MGDQPPTLDYVSPRSRPSHHLKFYLALVSIGLGILNSVWLFVPWIAFRLNLGIDPRDLYRLIIFGLSASAPIGLLLGIYARFGRYFVSFASIGIAVNAASVSGILLWIIFMLGG